MRSAHKSAFISALKRAFSRHNLVLSPTRDKTYINYMYDRFTDLKDPGDYHGQPLRVTNRFLFHYTSQFAKISPYDMACLVRQTRLRRSPSRYAQYKSLPPLSPHSSSAKLLNLLGRRSTPRFKVTDPSGTTLTPKRKSKARGISSTHPIGFSPQKVEPSSATSVRERSHSGSTGERYEKMMEVPGMTLWRKETPGRIKGSPYRIRVGKSRASDEELPTIRKLQFNRMELEVPTQETFAFTVTRQQLIERVNMARPISQRQVMGGYTALEVLKAVGALIADNQNGRYFHWAHRQGWTLGGDQVKTNLDPMTDGANYDTLFKVESPIKSLILDAGIESVKVLGTVEFDPESGLPQRVTYQIGWEDEGEEKSAVVIIDPLSTRRPTLEEHTVASSMFKI